MNVKRVIFQLTILLAISSILVACGAPAVEPTTEPQSEAPAAEPRAAGPTATSPPAAGQPKYGGTLIIGRGEGTESLDNYIASAPRAGYVYDNIYDGLVRLNPQGELEPRLAERWEAVEPDRWRFYLRNDVKWHNGDLFTAEDVKYHFDRIFNSDTPGRPAGLAPAVDHAEVVDEYTVDIVTKYPYALLPNDLAPRWQVISSNRTAIEEWGDQYGEHPVGTGPFKFVEWVKGDHITLEANDEFWGGRPYLDQVIFKEIPDDSTRTLAFKNGEIDLNYHPAAIDVLNMEGDPNYKILKVVSFVTQYLVSNTTSEPLGDLLVRQALAHGVDREGLVDFAFEGLAEPAHGLLSPGVEGYNAEVKPLEYDPDKARGLLEQAGWEDTNGDGIVDKDGQPLSLELSFAPGAREPQEVSEVLQAQMREIGVDLVLKQWESAALLTAMPKGEVQFFTYGQGLGTGHAGQLLNVHFHSTGGRNYHFFHRADPELSATLDDMLDASQSELDVAKRYQLWTDIQKIILEQAIFIPTYHTLEFSVAQADVMDAYMHPGEYLRMEKVWLDR